MAPGLQAGCPTVRTILLVSMDLLEAVREAGVVVGILRAERRDDAVFGAIYQTAVDIAAEFQVNSFGANAFLWLNGLSAYENEVYPLFARITPYQ